MKYQLEIKEEAKQDILSANAWYANEVSGLNVKFIQQVEHSIKIILKKPKTYKRISKQFPHAALHKFSYVIIYEYQADDKSYMASFTQARTPQKEIKAIKK